MRIRRQGLINKRQNKGFTFQILAINSLIRLLDYAIDEAMEFKLYGCIVHLQFAKEELISSIYDHEEQTFD